MAIHAVPSDWLNTTPDGDDTSVVAPFRSTVAPVCSAACRTKWRGRDSTSSRVTFTSPPVEGSEFSKVASSPAWGCQYPMSGAAFRQEAQGSGVDDHRQIVSKGQRAGFLRPLQLFLAVNPPGPQQPRLDSAGMIRLPQGFRSSGKHQLGRGLRPEIAHHAHSGESGRMNAQSSSSRETRRTCYYSQDAPASIYAHVGLAWAAKCQGPSQ